MRKKEATTPDGISGEDWDQVVGLAAEIANAACQDDYDLASARTVPLLELLARLEEKYGALPSLLATRADYVEDTVARVGLLKRAFELAELQNEPLNQTLAACTLAEIYIEEARNPEEGTHWLSVLETCLSQCDDEFARAELEGLRKELQALQEHRSGVHPKNETGS